MSYLALYRKYRPKDFLGVIGQDHIVKTLINQIKTDRLGHAYLFTGTRGTGKTSLAKIFARAINCQSPIDGSPCGQCACCKALLDPSNVDVIEIDAASNNGVEQIRDLREKVQYAPVQCKYKVYIIDEVHMLSGAAFNALLKTLEEPPTHAVFILATTEAHKIPATILSRCMRFDFKLIPTEEIAKHIENIFTQLNKGFEKEAILAIARAGEGSIRDALSIADIALSYNEGKLTYNQVTEILGTTNFESIKSLLQNIILGNTSAVFKTFDELLKSGKSVNVLTKDLVEMLRNLLIIKTCENSNQILSLPSDIYSDLEQVAKLTNAERILRIIEIFSNLENDLRYSVHPKVVFECATVKASKPETDYDLDALLVRVKTLEDAINNGKFTNYLDEKIEVKRAKSEEAKELNVVEIKNESQQKPSITISQIEDVRGRLLAGLRQNNNEMLWNFMQSVKITVENQSLVVETQTEDDAELIKKPDNVEKIKKALNLDGEYEIIIKASSVQKILDEIDQATDRIKRIFGEDIVIVQE